MFRSSCLGTLSSVDQALQASGLRAILSDSSWGHINQTAAVHSSSTQDTSSITAPQQQHQQRRSTQDASGPAAAASRFGCHSALQHVEQQHESRTAQEQLVGQGNVLTPQLGSQLWYAAFCGNAPTEWWHDPATSSSSELSTWSDVCSSSSYIQQQFRFSHSAYQSPFGLLLSQQADADADLPPRPRAEINRRAYVIQLHRQPSYVYRLDSRLRTAYVHRRIQQARLMQETALISSWQHKAAACRSQQPASKTDSMRHKGTLQHPAAGPEQQQQPQAHRRRRIPLRQAEPFQSQLGDLQASTQSAAWAQMQTQGESWAQMQLMRQRRCRLRSHGSVAAAAYLKRHQAANPSSSQSDVSQQSHSGLDWEVEPYVPDVWEGLGAAAAAEAAGTARPRKCVARRDDKGNLIPLPASCTGGCSSSSNSSREETAGPQSMCVAGIGCDLAAIAAEAKRARKAARERPLPRGLSLPGRTRALWTYSWLWGARTPTAAAAETAGDFADSEAVAAGAAAAGMQQSTASIAAGSSTPGFDSRESNTQDADSSSSRDGSGVVCHPSTNVVTAGWGARYYEEGMVADWPMPPTQPSSSSRSNHPYCDPPPAEPCEVTADEYDSSSYPCRRHDSYSSNFSGSSGYSPYESSRSSYSDTYSSSAYSESESESDHDYSSDDEMDYEYDYDDSSDAESVDRPRVPLRLQESRHVFRNERDVIYGFWSKCPLG